MDPLKSLDFSSFIIFFDDPWSLLVSFCQLFKLPLVVQCCNVICEWPLSVLNVKVIVRHFQPGEGAFPMIVKSSGNLREPSYEALLGRGGQ